MSVKVFFKALLAATKHLLMVLVLLLLVLQLSIRRERHLCPIFSDCLWLSARMLMPLLLVRR